MVLDNNVFVVLEEMRQLKREIYKKWGTFATWKYYATQLHDAFIGRYPFDVVHQAYKLLINEKSRRKRLNVKTSIMYVLCDYLYFGTITFTDGALASTTQETRRRYVARWLKENCEEYIANIDFGDKKKNPQSNEREHYHCLCYCPNGEKPSDWGLGFTKFKRVGNSPEDVSKVSHYINKLTNHALKVERTGKSKRLIYSRNSHIIKSLTKDIEPQPRTE